MQAWKAAKGEDPNNISAALKNNGFLQNHSLNRVEEAWIPPFLYPI